MGFSCVINEIELFAAAVGLHGACSIRRYTVSCQKTKLSPATCLIASNVCWDCRISQTCCPLTFTPWSIHFWHSIWHHDGLAECWVCAWQTAECCAPVLAHVCFLQSTNQQMKGGSAINRWLRFARFLAK